MGRRGWGEWQRAKKKMGETKEGLFGEAGDRQGPVWRDRILNEWGCLPEGREEEGLKLCVCLCVCVFFFFAWENGSGSVLGSFWKHLAGVVVS